MTRRVFLTGASSGIGRAAAELLADSGCSVWATARDTSRLPRHANLHPLSLDLEDPSSIDRAWAQAIGEAGEIDVLVQNAGAGIVGPVEEVALSEAARQWQILVMGPLQLLRLAAAHMRPRACGIIIGVSSLAAELPLPFGAHYSAGKAALSALLAGLAMELKPFQVRVVDLRPGDIRTAFNDRITPQLGLSSPYAPWQEAAWKETQALMDGAPEPSLVARAILHAIEHPHPIVRSGTFFQAKLGALGARFLPRGFLLDSIRHYFQLQQVDRTQGRSAKTPRT